MALCELLKFVLPGLLVGTACVSASGPGELATGAETAALGDDAGDDAPQETSDGAPHGSESGAPDIPPACGNGVVERDEECDLGFANAVDRACTPTCRIAVCGDGLVGPDEACDPADDPADDRPCTDDCQWASAVAAWFAADGPTHAADGAFGIAVGEGGDVSVLGWLVDEAGAGSGTSTGNDPANEVVVRLDRDAQRQWMRTFTPATTFTPDLSPTRIAVTADGQTIMARPLPSGGVTLVSLSVLGDERWSRPFHDTQAVQWEVGALVTVGDETLFARVDVSSWSNKQTTILRLDPEGNDVDQTQVDGNVTALAAAGGGDVFAVVERDLVRLRVDGTVVWSTEVYSSVPVQLSGALAGPVAVVRTPADNVPVLEVYEADDGAPRATTPLAFEPTAVVASAAEIFVTGEFPALPDALPTDTRIGVAVFDLDGVAVRERFHDGPAAGADRGQAIGLTAQGEPWVAGWVSVAFQGTDLWAGRFGDPSP